MTDAPLTVLIVDDHEPNLRLYAKVVGRISGTRAVCFTRSGDALRWLEASTPALVVLDLFTPAPDGFEFLKRMRKQNGNAAVPVIAVTLPGRPDLARKALSRGAALALNKPINANEFVEHARRLLGGAARVARPAMIGGVQSVIRERELVDKLFATLKARDRRFERHANLTTGYAERIGQAMRLPGGQMALLLAATPLHDIGMLSTPEYILLKTTPLDKRERRIIQDHTEQGHEILRDSSSKVLQAAAQIALTHHEHWDGTGYPARLRGNDIPVLGRIVAVAGAYAAMTTRRPYRPAFTNRDAIEEIDAASGHQFDPDIVRAFHLAFREISKFQTSLKD